MNHLFYDSWVTLLLPLLYNPSFSSPWSSFANFSFGEQEERPRVRVYSWFSREERILSKFSRFVHPIEVCEWRKLSQVWKLKNSPTIFKHKSFFHQTSNFFFHRTPWDTLFIMDCKKLIFNRISWNTYQNWMRHAYSWSKIKILSYEVIFNFSVFGRIFIAHAWFWMFNHFCQVFEFKNLLKLE